MPENDTQLTKKMSNKNNFNNVLLNGFLNHFKNPLNFNSLYFPALAIPIIDDGNCTEVLNCFFPRSDKRSDITQNAIHHHGQLRLTSTVIFGNGYRHLTFSKPVTTIGGEINFNIISDKIHNYGETTIVEPFVPHAVIAPENITITYAIWDKPLQTRSFKILRKILHDIKLFKLFFAIWCEVGLTSFRKMEYLDFYPANTGFIGMRNRVQFSKLSNLAYVQQLCYLIQEINNQELVHLMIDCLNKNKNKIINFHSYETLFSDILIGKPVQLWLEGFQYEELPHMNFSINDIYKAITY